MYTEIKKISDHILDVKGVMELLEKCLIYTNNENFLVYKLICYLFTCVKVILNLDQVYEKHEFSRISTDVKG